MQINNVSNEYGRMLDLVLVRDSTEVSVSRHYAPVVREDLYHPALLIEICYYGNHSSTDNVNNVTYHRNTY